MQQITYVLNLIREDYITIKNIKEDYFLSLTKVPLIL